MKKRLFTLIELLIVIAIIGILAGILIPVVSSSQASAAKVDCISNQKNTMTALTEEMAATDQRLISIAQKGDKSTWSKYLYDNSKLSDTKAFKCSSITYLTDETNPAEDAEALNNVFGVISSSETFTYANDTYTGLNFKGTKYTKCDGKIIAPSQLFIGCCFTAGTPYLTATTSPSLPDAHRGDVNIFCLDGSATSITLPASGKKQLNYYMPKLGGAQQITLSK